MRSIFVVTITVNEIIPNIAAITEATIHKLPGLPNWLSDLLPSLRFHDLEFVHKYFVGRQNQQHTLSNCIALSPLQYRVFPPYGLITEAFLPLGSYLLVIGLYTSAKHLARNASMRKWIYNGAQTQLRILKEIGVSQMERDLEKQLKITHSKASSIIDEPQLELEDEDFKKILYDVLTELYYSKT